MSGSPIARLSASLRTNPNFEGRDAALGQSDGLNPLGFVGAGAVEVQFADTFLVQNSGTPTDMGGITVGDGGLTVSTTGEGPGDMFIYGRQEERWYVTNDDFVPTVTLAAGSTFTANSAINECLLTQCARPPPPPPPPPARRRRRHRRRRAAPPPGPPPAPPLRRRVRPPDLLLARRRVRLLIAALAPPPGPPPGPPPPPLSKVPKRSSGRST